MCEIDRKGIRGGEGCGCECIILIVMFLKWIVNRFVLVLEFELWVLNWVMVLVMVICCGGRCEEFFFRKLIK